MKENAEKRKAREFAVAAAAFVAQTQVPELREQSGRPESDCASQDYRLYRKIASPTSTTVMIHRIVFLLPLLFSSAIVKKYSTDSSCASSAGLDPGPFRQLSSSINSANRCVEPIRNRRQRQ